MLSQEEGLARAFPNHVSGGKPLFLTEHHLPPSA